MADKKEENSQNSKSDKNSDNDGQAVDENSSDKKLSSVEDLEGIPVENEDEDKQENNEEEKKEENADENQENQPDADGTEGDRAHTVIQPQNDEITSGAVPTVADEAVQAAKREEILANRVKET